MTYNEIIAKIEQDYAEAKDSVWLNELLVGKLALEPNHDLVNVVKGLGFKFDDVKRRVVFHQLENAIIPIVCGDVLITARDIITTAMFEDEDYDDEYLDNMDEMAKAKLTAEIILFGKL